MFNDNDKLKKFFRDFLKDEIDELKQHKYRFFALVVSLLVSLSLIFTEDSGETIEVSNSTKIEESSDTTDKNGIETDKKTANKKVISVKKDKNNSNGEKVVAVLGANSDELYIGDPFQSDEEKPAKIQQKTPENVVIPQQVPIIPPQLSPIPDQTLDLPPIPSVTPIITEVATEPVKIPEKEFILTGTAINFNQKSAIVQKISTAQGKNVREENLIVSVGDSLEGHKIVDITPSAVIFDDGRKINSNYLAGDGIFINSDENDVEISDIPSDYAEIPVATPTIPELEIPPIPDAVNNYDEDLVENDNFEIKDTKIPDITINLEEDDLVKIDEVQIDEQPLNASAPEKSTEIELDTSSNIDFSADNNFDASPSNSDVSFNMQGIDFVSGDSSP